MNRDTSLPRRACAALLLTAALAAGAGCSKDAPAAGPPRMAPVFRVTTQPVATGTLTHGVEAIGSLEAYQVVTVPARVEGVLDRLDFDEGTAVTPETVLAVVDERRYSLVVDQAEAAVREAEAAAAQAKTAVPSAAARTTRVRAELAEAVANFDRWKALRAKDPGFVTEEKLLGLEAAAKGLAASLDEAIAGESEALARQRSAEAAIESRRAAVAIAKRNVDETRVRAPIAGLVEKRHVAAGQYVKVGDRIATIVDVRELRLRFSVSETQSVRLKRGESVSFRVSADPTRVYAAELIHVDATAEETTRMVGCLAVVKDPSPALKPGFFAQVTADIVARNDAIIVPDGALLATEKGVAAFVVEDGKAVQRLLTTGLHTKDGGVEVISGLKPGETLVVNGAQSLQPGVAVQVVVEGAAR